MTEKELIEALQQELKKLRDKYETEKQPLFIAANNKGMYLCPTCHKRTFFKHTHCHRCGQKLGWGKSKEG